jgi:hypothetical protein
MSKQVTAMGLFSSITAAAAADHAAEMSAQDVVRYLAAVGLLFRMPDLAEFATLDAWKEAQGSHKAASGQVAEYRQARGVIAARKYGDAGIRSFTMETAEWQALPEGPLKGYRVLAQTAARQALVDLRKRQYRMAEAVYTIAADTIEANKGKLNKGSGAGGSKDLLATFNDFATTSASRNQKTPELSAGDLSIALEKMRAIWTEALATKKK